MAESLKAQSAPAFPGVPGDMTPPAAQSTNTQTSTTGTQSGSASSAKVQPRRKPFKIPDLPGAKNIKTYGTMAFVALLAVILWWGDGFFTLWFMQGWVAALKSLGGFRWLIPWCITVGTLYTWPSAAKWRAVRAARRVWAEDGTEASMRKYIRARNQLLRHALFFFLLLAFNIGTSTQGIAEAAAGRYINLFGGFTLPAAGTMSLRLLSIVGGLIGAFGPEQLLRWVQDEYNDL